MKNFRHAIIGNSAAALNAATAIRQIDRDSQIVMLSAEDCLAYSPVVLPYLLSGKMDEKRMYIADREFYRRYDIDLRLETLAESIDTDRQEIILRGGARLGYDRLLIASGASPRKLSIDPGPARDRIFTLRTMADARAIVEASKSARDVLMIGAGLVGLETGYAMEKKGKNVIIMAKSGHLLSRNSDAACAQIVQERIEEQRIRFLFGRDVVEFSRVKGRVFAVTDCGDEIPADLVVVGKGVDPNTAVAKDTDIDTEWGIRVNLGMGTSVPGVYAAGDAAQARHLLTGRSETFGNWPSACVEGKIAGSNMAGKDIKLAGEVAFNVLPVFDTTAAFLERRDDGDDQTEVLTYSDRRKSIYRKILIKNDRVVGAVMLGACEDAGVLLYLLKKRRNIAGFKDDLASGRRMRWGRIVGDRFRNRPLSR